jgi:spectinomycin phosphotransferase
MLEKPDLDEEAICACLRDDYVLSGVQIGFLPLGADLHTAVYRAVASDGAVYMVKLRRPPFDELSVALPHWLHKQGIAQIITPLTTQAGQLWAELGADKVIVYPFIEGRDGYQVQLTDRQWVEFGAALRRIHTTPLPRALRRRIRPVTYPRQWRESVRAALARAEEEAFDDSLAAKLASFLRTNRDEIRGLVGRAEELVPEVQARVQEPVLCHSDLHAGNLHIVDDQTFYIVDWDDPILAPKERDLMFIGGGLMGGSRTAGEEERLFYQGYGAAEIDRTALAYFRYARIVEDLAIFVEQILSTDQGADREQAFTYLASNFRPDNTIELARRADDG